MGNKSDKWYSESRLMESHRDLKLDHVNNIGNNRYDKIQKLVR